MGRTNIALLDRHVEELLTPFASRNGPGVSLGVMLGGRLVVHRHAGLASVEHGVPICAETCFRIASVTKQFTCAAILTLAAEDKISLNDDARLHLPELPEWAERVTIAHLMHNSSGVRDMIEIMRHGGADLATPVRLENLMDGICRQRTLDFRPGSRYLYSNSNFFLLGRIVERLSGESLGSFLSAHIFAPLGMSATRMAADVQEAVPNLATGYFPRDGGGWTRAPHAFPLHGEGGLVSNVVDLALWDHNFLTRRIGDAWLDELVRQTRFTNGTVNPYARGLVVHAYRGIDAVSHSGLWPGYKTEFMRVPSQQAAVIAVSNHGGADLNLLMLRVLDAVLARAPGMRPVPKLPGAQKLRDLSGRYLDPESGHTLDVALIAGERPTLTLNGLTVDAVATENERLASPVGSGIFILRIAGSGAIAVEREAGQTSTWHRVTSEPNLPVGLAGIYRSEEMAATWTLTQIQGKAWVRASGPVATGPDWAIEAIQGDNLRLHMPGALLRTWWDLRLLRDDEGTVIGLTVSGRRAKDVLYRRMTDLEVT